MSALRQTQGERYLSDCGEPFDTVHPELAEGMNGAQDRLVEPQAQGERRQPN